MKWGWGCGGGSGPHFAFPFLCWDSLPPQGSFPLALWVVGGNLQGAAWHWGQGPPTTGLGAALSRASICSPHFLGGQENPRAWDAWSHSSQSMLALGKNSSMQATFLMSFCHPASSCQTIGVPYTPQGTGYLTGFPERHLVHLETVNLSDMSIQAASSVPGPWEVGRGSSVGRQLARGLESRSHSLSGPAPAN